MWVMGRNWREPAVTQEAQVDTNQRDHSQQQRVWIHKSFLRCVNTNPYVHNIYDLTFTSHCSSSIVTTEHLKT